MPHRLGTPSARLAGSSDLLWTLTREASHHQLPKTRNEQTRPQLLAGRFDLHGGLAMPSSRGCRVGAGTGTFDDTLGSGGEPHKCLAGLSSPPTGQTGLDEFKR